MPWSIPRKYICPEPGCGAEFESTANHEPKRCPACRKKRNHHRAAENYRRRRSGIERVYWTSEKQQRQYHHLICTECSKKIWTSSCKGKGFVCISCKRAAGLTANGREGHYTTLVAPPKQIITFGRCPKCKRGSKRQPLKLINDKCEECHWYDIPEIDPDLSANARKGRGGHNDFIRRK